MLSAMRILAVQSVLMAGVIACAVSSSRGEDVQLRSRAVSLMSHAHLVSTIQGGPWNIRTEVTYSATEAEGALQSGTYTRVRAKDGELREDVSLGEYSASYITAGTQRAYTANWDDQPYGATMVRALVPFFTGAFDSSDVIQEIRSSSYGGRQANCIEFETIVGEKHLPGEACFDKANGTLLELRTGNRLWEYSGFFSFKGGWFPAHLSLRNGDFSLTAEMTMTALDDKPEEAFVIPPEWRQGSLCHQFEFPIAKSAPQPEGRGGSEAPITDVDVRFHVTATGTVEDAQVLKPVRPDLDAEAVKIVQSWIFQPGMCNGSAQPYVIQGVVHFQGR